MVEQRWRDRFGAQAIAGLRAALTAITADLDPSLPDCLPILAGVSGEAVAMAMGVLGKQALATEGPDPGGARWRVARLTESGRQAQVAHAGRVAAVEDSWRQRFRGNSVAALGAALAGLPERDLLAGMTPYPGGWRAQVRPPAVLPHYPMVLHRGGYPDGS